MTINLYACSIAMSDGSINNFFWNGGSREEVIKEVVALDPVVSRLARGRVITCMSAEPITAAVQNTPYDFTSNINNGEMLGVYFNFQKGYASDLKRDLEILIKKHFGFDIDIKEKP